LTISTDIDFPQAALRNAATGAPRTAGVTNIPAGTWRHARDSSRPLALPGIT
jgi:hypothetical protein